MQSAELKSSRLDSIDLLRGLVMMLMALDHTRSFFHSGAYQEAGPLNATDGSIPLFFTRWIAHLCAPVFVFLAGTGAFLSTTRGKSRPGLSTFLLTRGVWLIALELTWVHWAGWSFSFELHQHQGLALWAIGWSMIALAALVHLPIWTIATLGVSILTLHNTLDSLTPDQFGALGCLWRILHEGGDWTWARIKFTAGYPILPWIGVMATGYSFGAVMLKEPAQRQRWLLRVGLNLLVVFFILRFTNLYGDAKLWTSQPTGFRTLLSMLDCTTQPPSLCYLLLTLGTAAIVLARLDFKTPEFLKPLLVFGRVPLFFYLLHLPLIHGLAVAVNMIRFDRADWLFGSHPARPPPGAGFDLPFVYLMWMVAIIILYPACQWFANLKQRRTDRWLRYL